MEISSIKNYWEDGLPQQWYSKKKYNTPEYWDEIENLRYTKHYKYLPSLGEFHQHKNQKVLEIGTGVGTDILQFAKNGSICYGIELTDTGTKITNKRFKENKLKGNIKQGSGENLPFKDNFFDLVYSFGVLHHTTNTDKALKEVYRVLKPNGKIIIALYRKDWWYYLFVPLYHGIFQKHYKTHSHVQLSNKFTEVKGNVPVARRYNISELRKKFRKYRNLRFYVKPNREDLGYKYRKLNKMFCTTMNKLFGGGLVIVKGIKR